MNNDKENTTAVQPNSEVEETRKLAEAKQKEAEDIINDAMSQADRTMKDVTSALQKLDEVFRKVR